MKQKQGTLESLESDSILSEDEEGKVHERKRR